jgi:hypothetical protein
MRGQKNMQSQPVILNNLQNVIIGDSRNVLTQNIFSNEGQQRQQPQLGVKRSWSEAYPSQAPVPSPTTPMPQEQLQQVIAHSLKQIREAQSAANSSNATNKMAATQKAKLLQMGANALQRLVEQRKGSAVQTPVQSAVPKDSMYDAGRVQNQNQQQLS